MSSHNALRALLFAAFFAAGTAALSGAVLCGELLTYYENRALLKAAENYTAQIKMLNGDYDVLLDQLQNDPNALKRIAQATLGKNVAPQPNTLYPKATAKQLAAARKTLGLQDSRYSESEKVHVPDSLVRINQPLRRAALFLSGAFLIIISFAWFGPTRREPQDQTAAQQQEPRQG